MAINAISSSIVAREAINAGFYEVVDVRVDTTNKNIYCEVVVGEASTDITNKTSKSIRLTILVVDQTTYDSAVAAGVTQTGLESLVDAKLVALFPPFT